jgi:hypothetical protein
MNITRGIVPLSGLSGSIFVVASEFKVYVHIRHHTENKTPTKDGIALMLSRWKKLENIFDAIAKAVEEYPSNFKYYLGGNHYVSITEGYGRVDLWKFWLPEGLDQIKATLKGISLTFEAFGKLKDCVSTIDSHIPELEAVVPCFHQNQLDLLWCTECSPNERGCY